MENQNQQDPMEFIGQPQTTQSHAFDALANEMEEQKPEQRSSRASLIGEKLSRTSTTKKKGVFVLGGGKKGDDLLGGKKVPSQARRSIKGNDLASSQHSSGLGENEDFNQLDYSGEIDYTNKDIQAQQVAEQIQQEIVSIPNENPQPEIEQKAPDVDLDKLRLRLKAMSQIERLNILRKEFDLGKGQNSSLRSVGITNRDSLLQQFDQQKLKKLTLIQLDFLVELLIPPTQERNSFSGRPSATRLSVTSNSLRSSGASLDNEEDERKRKDTYQNQQGVHNVAGFGGAINFQVSGSNENIEDNPFLQEQNTAGTQGRILPNTDTERQQNSQDQSDYLNKDAEVNFDKSQNGGLSEKKNQKHQKKAEKKSKKSLNMDLAKPEGNQCMDKCQIF